MIIALLIALLFPPANVIQNDCYLLNVGNGDTAMYVWVSQTTQNGLCNG